MPNLQAMGTTAHLAIGAAGLLDAYLVRSIGSDPDLSAEAANLAT